MCTWGGRSRNLYIRNFFDDWLPPKVRDSRILMAPILRLTLGTKWRAFADFKPVGFTLSHEQFAAVYEDVTDAWVQPVTDLNKPCLDAILNAAEGKTLDAGCGRGYLVDRLAARGLDVTGCDIVLSPSLTDREGVRYVHGNVEALPFADDEFDTVISTHTLEHVQNIQSALAELRRVAKHRLIVVVPRERPYRYSFNLHLHFFPHPWSWQAVAGVRPSAVLADLGDWVYVEPQAT